MNKSIFNDSMKSIDYESTNKRIFVASIKIKMSEDIIIIL